MNRIQRYLFFAVLQAVLAIVGGLALLALLAQGLSQTELIVDNRQSALTYLKVVALGAPQIIAVLTPLAIFVAALNALNKIHRDSEIVVAQAAGMTRWQILSPVMRLAVMAALVHLSVNLWGQPTAQRELRETISNARADLAASLVRPGAFTYPTEGLTFYARDTRAGTLRDLLISDSRTPDASVDYLATEGIVIEVEGSPAISMTDGQIQQTDELGQLSILNFDQYVFDLSPFLKEDSDLVLKASDRYLNELFFPDLSDFYQNRDQDRYTAEAHTRLAGPLLNLAMAALAVLAVTGGQYSRRGYQRRIGIAVIVALLMVVLALVIQSASIDDPALNAVQYLLPIAFLSVTIFIYLSGRSTFSKLRKRAHPPLAAGAVS